MVTMEEYFPFITKAFDVMQYTAWAVLFLIVVWQLFRAFGGPITEAENPWQLVVRGAIFALLIGYAKPIFMLALDIAKMCIRDSTGHADENDVVHGALSLSVFGDSLSIPPEELKGKRKNPSGKKPDHRGDPAARQGGDRGNPDPPPFPLGFFLFPFNSDVYKRQVPAPHRQR